MAGTTISCTPSATHCQSSDSRLAVELGSLGIYESTDVAFGNENTRPGSIDFCTACTWFSGAGLTGYRSSASA